MLTVITPVRLEKSGKFAIKRVVLSHNGPCCYKTATRIDGRLLPTFHTFQAAVTFRDTFVEPGECVIDSARVK